MMEIYPHTAETYEHFRPEIRFDLRQRSTRNPKQQNFFFWNGGIYTDQPTTTTILGLNSGGGGSFWLADWMKAKAKVVDRESHHFGFFFWKVSLGFFW